MTDIITGKVVRVIDGLTIVINRGEAEGVTFENKFLILLPLK